MELLRINTQLARRYCRALLLRPVAHALAAVQQDDAPHPLLLGPTNVRVGWSGKTASAPSSLLLLLPDATLPRGSPLTRKKYTPASKAECVR